MVMSLSFQFNMVLVDITPGIAHAKLEIKGTMLLPFKPKGLMMRSIIKTTRDRYPVSSKMAIKKKSKAI